MPGCAGAALLAAREPSLRTITLDTGDSWGPARAGSGAPTAPRPAATSPGFAPLSLPLYVPSLGGHRGHVNNRAAGAALVPSPETRGPGRQSRCNSQGAASLPYATSPTRRHDSGAGDLKKGRLWPRAKGQCGSFLLAAAAVVLPGPARDARLCPGLHIQATQCSRLPLSVGVGGFPSEVTEEAAPSRQASGAAQL